MRRGRPRRSRVNWFPLFGEETGNEEIVAAREVSVEVNELLQTVGGPLTWDRPKEAAAQIGDPNTSLADAIGSGYILKRIVGKWMLGLEQDSDLETPDGGLIGAGFFVARAAGDGQAAEEPIGGFANYNPLAINNEREPWIWRRTWILSNEGKFAGGPNRRPYGCFNISTSRQSSALDSGHIDAKTIRKVVNDNRLWWVVGTLGLGFDTPWNASLALLGILDVRILGTLVKGRQSGVF